MHLGGIRHCVPLAKSHADFFNQNQIELGFFLPLHQRDFKFVLLQLAY